MRNVDGRCEMLTVQGDGDWWMVGDCHEIMDVGHWFGRFSLRAARADFRHRYPLPARPLSICLRSPWSGQEVPNFSKMNSRRRFHGSKIGCPSVQLSTLRLVVELQSSPRVSTFLSTFSAPPVDQVVVGIWTYRIIYSNSPQCSQELAFRTS